MNIILSIVVSTFVLAEPPKSYETCTELVVSRPERALSYAEQWGALGGGDAAAHCKAMAYLALESASLAAAILQELALKALAGDAGVASRLFIQSAEAWMVAGNKAESYAALRDAYDLTPDAAELHMSAATVYATGKQWEGVTLALTALERHSPLSADALALRARAYLRLENNVNAVRDVTAALKINPLLIDALVLRGDLLELGVSLPDIP